MYTAVAKLKTFVDNRPLTSSSSPVRTSFVGARGKVEVPRPYPPANLSTVLEYPVSQCPTTALLNGHRSFVLPTNEPGGEATGVGILVEAIRGPESSGGEGRTSRV